MSANEDSTIKTQSPINLKDFEENEAVESEDVDGFVNVDTEEEDTEEENSSGSLRDFVVNDEKQQQEEEEEEEEQQQRQEKEEEEAQVEAQVEAQEEAQEEAQVEENEKKKEDTIKKEVWFELSDLELASLASKTMVEFALQLEKQVSIHKLNPFTNHLDEIAFTKKI